MSFWCGTLRVTGWLEQGPRPSVQRKGAQVSQRMLSDDLVQQGLAQIPWMMCLERCFVMRPRRHEKHRNRLQSLMLMRKEHLREKYGDLGR